MTVDRIGTVRDPAQFVIVVGLAALGVLVIVDALGLNRVVAGNDPLGPRPVPILLGAGAIVVAVYAIDVLRGGVGERDASEDVAENSRTDWRTVLVLAVAFIANAVLIEPLGWVISSTILFWLASFALGNRHHIRSLLIGLVLALGTFYGFAIGLGVNLPAGILRGIL